MEEHFYSSVLRGASGISAVTGEPAIGEKPGTANPGNPDQFAVNADSHRWGNHLSEQSVFILFGGDPHVIGPAE